MVNGHKSLNIDEGKGGKQKWDYRPGRDQRQHIDGRIWADSHRKCCEQEHVYERARTCGQYGLLVGIGTDYSLGQNRNLGVGNKATTSECSNDQFQGQVFARNNSITTDLNVNLLRSRDPIESGRNPANQYHAEQIDRKTLNPFKNQSGVIKHGNDFYSFWIWNGNKRRIRLIKCPNMVRKTSGFLRGKVKEVGYGLKKGLGVRDSNTCGFLGAQALQDCEVR